MTDKERIAELQAENERLRAALQEGLDMWLESHAECNWSEQARVALYGRKDGAK